MNDSLEELIDLLRTEVERLKVDLETFRLTENPNKERITAELIRAIDHRQDRLEELQALWNALPPDDGSGDDTDSVPQVH